MKRPADFTKSALFAISIVSVLNMIVSTFSVLTYGDSMRDTVISSIQTFWIQQAVNIMITLHCLMTTTLIINPLNQTTEELFKIPQGFTIKRVLVRAGIMGLAVFVAESIPSFGPVMDLIGGSTVTATSFTFPCLFYLFLSAKEEKRLQEGEEHNDEPLTFAEMVQKTKLSTLLLAGSIIVFSVLLGGVATVTAMDSITREHFQPPCYLKSFFPAPQLGDTSRSANYINCCGSAQNVSRHGNPVDFCTKPDFEFY